MKRCRVRGRRNPAEPARSPVRDRSSTRREARRRGAGVGTEVDQLLSSHGADAAVTVHAEYAGQATPNARWTQQPGACVRPVANRPAQPTDRDAIQAHLALMEHGRKVGKPSQAEHAAQRRPGRVSTDIRLSRSHHSRPVLVTSDWIGARTAWLIGRSGQRTASLSRAGPVLPRRSILGRKKIAWPGARPFSRSHIRCQACSPSSVTGTDAVVRGGVM